MHVSNVQIFAIESVMDGVTDSRVKKMMKIKRKKKKRKRRHGNHDKLKLTGMSRSQTGPPGKASPNEREKKERNSAHHLQYPGNSDSELTPSISTEADVASLKDPLQDMEFSEAKEPQESSMNNPESEAMVVGEQKEDSQLEISMKVEENATSDPVISDVDRDDKDPNDSRTVPSVPEEQLPLGDSEKLPTTSIVSTGLVEQVVEKTPTEAATLPSSNEEEKPRVSDEDEEKSQDAFEKHPQPSINQIVPAESPAKTDLPSNTNVIIGEQGGEHVVKTFPNEKEIAGVHDQELRAKDSEIAEDGLNATMSKADPPPRIVKKLSKERIEGFIEQSALTLKHNPSPAALMADRDSGELYDTEGVVKSGERVDDRSRFDISFAKKAEQISNAFITGDLSSVNRESRKDELNGVEQLGIVKNKSGSLIESEISRHYTYTAEEMARMNLVDAAKRKDEIERLMTEDFKRKTSSPKHLATEIDGRTRFRKDSLLRKMNENRIKKTVDGKDLKVNVGVKDRKSAYLAMASQNNRDSIEKKKRKVSAVDIRKSRGNAHSKYRNSVKRQSSQTVSGRPKSPTQRRTSRPRLNAKRESWRRESESGVSQRNRSYTEHKAADERSKGKVVSPRLSASEIERAKLKAVDELASKQSYPYGPNAAKMLEIRKSDSSLNIEKNQSEFYSINEENEADE